MTDMTANSDAARPDEREGLYYLWHLYAVGLCYKHGTPVRDVWPVPPYETGDDVRVTIALIDNGTVSKHPNLPHNFLVGTIDLTTSPRGIAFEGRGPEPCDAAANAAKAGSGDRDILDDAEEFVEMHASLDRHDQAYLKGLFAEVRDIVDGGEARNERERERAEQNGPDELILGALRGDDSKGVRPGGASNDNSADDGYLMNQMWGALPMDHALNSSERFSAHGTSSAGLICAGRPRKKRKRNPFAMSYAGVNPEARILSIVTPYSPDYWPLIIALMLAKKRSVEVILLPRAVEDMDEPPCAQEMGRYHGMVAAAFHETGGEDTKVNPRWTRKMADRGRYLQKLVLEALLCLISHEIPVVLPAGNSGRGELSFPASLTTAKHTKDHQHLIVVGACSAKGKRSAYSAGGNDVTVFAPSDDAQQVDQDIVRFDEMSWRGRRVHWNPAEKTMNTYSPYGIVAIDIPGEYGYASEANDSRDYLEEGGSPESKETAKSPEFQPRSLYTLFGGTSAAAAIVAGVVSLGARKRKKSEADRLTGADAKKLLMGTVKPARDYEHDYGIGDKPNEDVVEHLVNAECFHNAV